MTTTQPLTTLAKNEDELDRLTLSKLSEQEQKKVQTILKDFKIESPQDVMQYGVGTQTKISEFSNTILEQVRAKDTGEIGETLTHLMLKVQDLDIKNLGQGNIFANVPLIGPLVDNVRNFIAKFEKLNVQIEKIVENLDTSKMELLKDITMLENLYGRNTEYVRDIELLIVAGNEKIRELHETILPKLKAEAEKTNDQMKAQQYNDMKQLTANLEKKLHDLKLTRVVAIQTAPQIRIVQSNNQVLAEKIQSSILNTIPLWKNQIVLAISILRQQKALKAQQEVTKATKEILERNSEMLKQNAIGIAEENEKGIVDIKTLQKVNNDLIETIEKTIDIQKKGREQRIEAERELIHIESDLKERLVGIKVS